MKALVGDGLRHELSLSPPSTKLRSIVFISDIVLIDKPIGNLLQKLLEMRRSSDDCAYERGDILTKLADNGVRVDADSGDIFDEAVRSYLSRYTEFAAALKRGLNDIVPGPLLEILSSVELGKVITGK